MRITKSLLFPTLPSVCANSCISQPRLQRRLLTDFAMELDDDQTCSSELINSHRSISSCGDKADTEPKSAAIHHIANLDTANAATLMHSRKKKSTINMLNKIIIGGLVVSSNLFAVNAYPPCTDDTDCKSNKYPYLCVHKTTAAISGVRETNAGYCWPEAQTGNKIGAPCRLPGRLYESSMCEGSPQITCSSSFECDSIDNLGGNGQKCFVHGLIDRERGCKVNDPALECKTDGYCRKK